MNKYVKINLGEKLEDSDKESSLSMLASEETLKKEWYNPADKRWNNL